MGTLRLASNITEENLNTIYSSPYIVGAIKSNTPVNNPLAKYISAFIDNEFLGCFLTINFSKHEIEIHSLLLEKALPYSRELGRMILSKCFNENDIMRITAPIRETSHTVKNYVKKLGFKLEGIKRNATIENDKPISVEYYGLLRGELVWAS